MIGSTDKELLQPAVGRGSSTKLGHVWKSAEINLNVLTMTLMPSGRVDTSESVADMFTVKHLRNATLLILATSSLLFFRSSLKPSQFQLKHMKST